MASSYSLMVALFLILIIQFSTLPNTCLAARKIISPPSEGEDIGFIQDSCSTTNNRNLCLSTFSRYASEVQYNLELLTSTALKYTLNTTHSTTKWLTKLSKTKGLNPKEIAALKVCVQQVNESLHKLKDSVDEMGLGAKGKSSQLVMGNIQTWVSTALTYEQTCMEDSGKALNGNIKLKTTVRGGILKLSQITSIALAFVNEYAATKHKV